MSLWVVVILFFVGGSVFVYPSRTMLAWSLDGMAPSWLGNVSKKFSSPHSALIISAGVGLVFLGLFAFTDWLTVVSGFLGFAINFLVVCAWAIVFPFVRKETFENSPIAWRLGRVPVISIIGAVATLIIIPVMYLLVTDTVFNLSISFTIWGAVVSIALGFIWYFIQRSISRRKGVDVQTKYSEIPVD
jgi:amino acid transporter